jgi:hypothetical protein
VKYLKSDGKDAREAEDKDAADGKDRNIFDIYIDGERRKFF